MLSAYGGAVAALTVVSASILGLSYNIGKGIIGATTGSELAVPGFLATLGLAIASVVRQFGKMIRNGDIVFVNAVKRDAELTDLVDDTRVVLASVVKALEKINQEMKDNRHREDSYRELVLTLDIFTGIREGRIPQSVDRRKQVEDNHPNRRRSDDERS